MLGASVWRAQPVSIGCLTDLRPASTNTGASAVTQYLSIRYSERLAEVGGAASVGSPGDSCDNALAEGIPF
jgi:hypothetical protein